jgi:hypothetical protein
LAVAAIEEAAAGASELPGPNPPPPARHCAQTHSPADSRSQILDFFIPWRRRAPRSLTRRRRRFLFSEIRFGGDRWRSGRSSRSSYGVCGVASPIATALRLPRSPFLSDFPRARGGRRD